MAPALVVANAPYKVYPGGVIALRCTDWLGPARGTLTTEIDARAVTGEVVRDTQTVTAVIRTAATAAFQEADDTLVIDFSTLPLEIDMTYSVWVSALIEGDWDDTNLDTYRDAFNDKHNAACQLAWYGDTVLFLSDSDFATVFAKPRAREHFWYSFFGGNFNIGDVVGTEMLHWRAYSQAGTTCEWLLDQIVLIPIVVSGTKALQWRTGDFRRVGGSHNTFGVASPFIDGADGGDDNGIFTYRPDPFNALSNWSGAEGGGDYQRKAAYSGAEYMLRVEVDDGYALKDTESNSEAPAYAYSLGGITFWPAQDWFTDDFNRTEANQWGRTSKGFAWRLLTGFRNCLSVGGGQGVITTTAFNVNLTGARVSMHPNFGVAPPDPLGAFLVADHFLMEGKVEFTATPNPGGSIILGVVGPASPGHTWGAVINLNALTWQMEMTRSGAVPYVFSGSNAVAWFTAGTFARFKVEVKRYLIRIKIWEDGTGEPGAWDFEDFMPTADDAAAENAVDYNYGGINPFLDADLDDVVNFSPVVGSNLVGAGSSNNTWSSIWDDITVSTNPYGNAENTSIAVERPEGTKVGEIVIPEGAQHIVSWGARDWTELDAFSDEMIAFAARVWNNSAAAELQRAELAWFYFRSIHSVLVSMNWREADRTGVATRVLVGG